MHHHKINNLFHIFLPLLLLTACFLYAAQPVSAEPIKFIPQVIGDIGFGSNGAPMDIDGWSLAKFIVVLNKYLIGIVGILATVVMMYGGVLWLTSSDSGGVKEAQEWITGAIVGLILAMCSFLILSTINPATTKMKNLNFPKVNEIKIQNPTQNPTNDTDDSYKDSIAPTGL